MNPPAPERRGLAWLSLFASTGTLICCALPILLVSLGMGAVVAALTSSFPFLITLSQHKILIFLIAGVLLLITGGVLYRPGRQCPTDPALAARCRQAGNWSRRIFWLSVGIWCIGFFAAWLALPLQVWLEG
ncbi:MAG TPA: hypothetical protein ENK40_02200 [Gammaproteobacteria bacterium]|nr:hypothetical protein [Gammaproteobacteria bacterium]